MVAVSTASPPEHTAGAQLPPWFALGITVMSLATVPGFTVRLAVARGAVPVSRTVMVTAEAMPAALRLIVEDDGPGFEPAAAPDHHGLALLRERLRLSFGDRGWLEVSSRPGLTQVVLTVPR